MKLVSGSDTKAPKLPPEPDRVMRRDRSSGGAHRVHIAIMDGYVTP